MFIGREIELNYFENKYNTPGGQLVVLYGRRRIGKTEIDIVAFDKSSDNYILGECKFRNSEMDVEIIAQLTEKSSIAKKDATINYMLFSKSGFTQKLIDLAKNNNNLKLFSLSDVLKY